MAADGSVCLSDDDIINAITTTRKDKHKRPDIAQVVKYLSPSFNDDSSLIEAKVQNLIINGKIEEKDMPTGKSLFVNELIDNRSEAQIENTIINNNNTPDSSYEKNMAYIFESIFENI